VTLTVGDVQERAKELRHLAESDEPLAHLLGCLDLASDLLKETGADASALVIEMHRAELVAGREWPGERIRDPFPPELEAVA
jgi:hypothetical protein